MPRVEEHPSLEGAFAHGVVAVIGQKDRVVRGHVDAVRAVKHALAPRAQEMAVAVEHHHRVRAAAEGIDVVVPVDPDRGNVGVELPALGQLGPIVDDLVAEAVGSENDRHDVLLHHRIGRDYRPIPRRLNAKPARPGAAGSAAPES